MRIGKPIPKKIKGQNGVGGKYGAAKEIPVNIINRKLSHLIMEMIQPDCLSDMMEGLEFVVIVEKCFFLWTKAFHSIPINLI
jgi:hypothetical protein